MKREEKNALSRQRILDAAMAEFSQKGYEGASLNTVWAENGISKGAVYHHFQDKDQIYLICVGLCFDALTAYLEEAARAFSGTATERLEEYFDARLRFFAENPLYLGIFSHTALTPPAELSAAIGERRRGFDKLNISVLTGLLSGKKLRRELTVDRIVEDFRLYMDYFNLRYRDLRAGGLSPEAALREHEERCHRQLDILLHGVLGD